MGEGTQVKKEEGRGEVEVNKGAWQGWGMGLRGVGAAQGMEAKEEGDEEGEAKGAKGEGHKGRCYQVVVERLG